MVSFVEFLPPRDLRLWCVACTGLDIKGGYFRFKFDIKEAFFKKKLNKKKLQKAQYCAFGSRYNFKFSRGMFYWYFEKFPFYQTVFFQVQ